MFYSILISIGLISTFISIILLRPIAFKIKLLDYPDFRKQHKGKIPLIGGLSIFSGLIVYLIYIDTLSLLSKIILTSSALILMLGVYDDFKNLKPRIKLFIQLFIVVFTIYISGIKIESLGFIFGLPYPLDLGFLAIPFSIISMVGLMNAFNMIDGLDGQAGLLSVNAILGIFIFGMDQVNSELYEMLVIIFTGLIIFLAFNFSSIKKMKIFLGDGGSLFLGFLISVSLIYSTQVLKLFSPSFALWCVAIPLFDFFSVVTLRKIEKQKITMANRDHIHHFLETFNLSKKFISFLTSSFGIMLLIIGYYLEVNFPAFSFWIFIAIFIIYLKIRIYYRIKIKNI